MWALLALLSLTRPGWAAEPIDAPLDPPPSVPACAADPALTLAVVGDVLVHRALQMQAWREPDRFRSLWSPVVELIARADVAYANLEGPMAWGLNRLWAAMPDPGDVFDDEVYTGYRRFNYHPRLGLDLRASGFHIVSTANNHAIDRGPLGIDRTIDAIEQADLAFVGTRPRGSSAPFVAFTERRGWRVAWVACADWTNLIDDDFDQVAECRGAERDRLLATIRRLRARSDVHLVVFTPHWGWSYRAAPDVAQRELAAQAIGAGVDLVVGNHSHVLQPWVEIEAAGRRGLVMYSMGNFVSHQQKPATRASAIGFVGLRPVGGRLQVAGAGYVPLHTQHDPVSDRFVTRPLHGEQADPEAWAVIAEVLDPARRLSSSAAGRADCGAGGR